MKHVLLPHKRKFYQKKLRYVYVRYRVVWRTELERCTRIFDDLQAAEWFAENVHGEIFYEKWDLFPPAPF